ncbi:uncharacterized protein [Panulirus ornatus]|uniref:uncharacterized protein isoform X2 n=1 Tax=Panulirus ornatus TaxID=150431 RepID=UPI003A83655A
MADASLDDIIKQRKIRPSNQQGNRTNINGALGRNRPPLKGRLNHSVRSDLGIVPKVGGDVRNKIIQKKRLRLRDARDRLAEIAKQGDARDRINKMRKKTGTQSNLVKKLNTQSNLMKNVSTESSQVKKIPVGWKNPGIVEKSIRNENSSSNLQGKTQMQGSSLIRTVSGGNRSIGKGVSVRGKPSTISRSSPAIGRPQSVSKTIDGSRYHPLPNNPHVVTIKNEKADLLYTRALKRQREMRSPPMKFFARSPPIRSMGLSTTMSYSPGLSGMRSDAMTRGWSPEHHIYRTRRSPEPEEIRPTRLRITTANNYREPSPHYSDDWDSPTRLPARLPSRMLAARLPTEIPDRLAVRVPAKKRPIYDAELDPPTRPKKVAPLSSGLMARLDHPVRPAPEEGKVLVTNLHRCVSVEDMEELFGTIGPIRTARMLREGIAEAVFMSMEDAYRAVEVFNNRQLDGQPMSVTVVNKKTQSLPAAPLPPAPPRTQTKSVLKAASGSSSMSRGLPSLRGLKKDDQVAPDISTIHHALFNRSQAPNSNHMFLVKLPKQPTKKEIT